MGARAEQQFRGTSRFDVRGQVGQGGSGFVYEALDRESNSRVALKALRVPNAESILLLKNEFRVLQDLNHPSLVIPKELFEANGQWFFSMDFVDGVSFLAHVRPSASQRGNDESGTRAVDHDAPVTGALDVARLREGLAQIALALSALHAHHKVHRDIKPSNILVTAEGRVVLLDFGIVSDLSRPAEGDDEGMVGTVAYMAPEQALGETVTPAADWYAVGTMLYEALTGHLPFTGPLDLVIAGKMTRAPAAPCTVADGIPDDLNQLCIDLLQPSPDARPEGLEILRRLGVTSAGPDVARPPTFVGRQNELRAIDAAFEETAAGKAVTVLVAGESGVGKSQLVREFTTRTAKRASALVFRGRCYERESVPYKAFDSLIDDLARFMASLSDARAAAILPEQAGLLRKLFPVLETISLVREGRITQLDVQNPQEVRARMFELLRALFFNIAREHRLVLVIDDLQWADADSLALLAEMMRPPNAPPLLLVASIRRGTEEAPDVALARERLARLTGDVRTIDLTTLSSDDARALAQKLLDAAGGGSAEDIESILGEAKGHPLFIDELVRHRALHRADHDTGAAPTRLDEALWERASRVSDDARNLLELVAVAGSPLAQQVVADASGLAMGKVFDAMTTLRSGHFVRTSGVYRRDTVEPYHDRVRESVLFHIDDTRRKALHGRLAIALERSGEADAEKLAAHWHGAGEPVRALAYAIRAADKAAAALAFDHAAALYRRAIDLAPASEEASSSRDLRVKLAEALTNAGRGAEAARVYLEAAGDDRSIEALDLRRRAAEELMNSGHMDEGGKTLDAVLDAVGVHAPRTPLGIILSLIFHTIVLKIRGLGFVARKKSEIDPRDLLRLDCLYSAGLGFGMTDHLRGKSFQLRTVLAGLRIGDKPRAMRALAFYAAASASAGGPAFESTMALQKTVRERSADLRQPFIDAMTTGVAAYAYQFTGQWAKARDAFVEAEAIFRDQCVGATFELASMRMLLCRTYVHLGNVKELARRADAILREAETRGDLYTIVNVSGPTSFVALARDDVRTAQKLLDHASSHLSKNGFHVQHCFCLLSQAQVSLYAGDPAAALAELDAKWPALKRSLLLKVQSFLIQLTDVRARARIALAATDRTKRPALLQAAKKDIATLEAMRMPWPYALAMLLRAGVCEVSGDRAGALAQLTTAESALASLDMALVRNVVARRRGMLEGGSAGRSAREDAEQWMSAQGIGDAARISALFSPGFTEEDDSRVHPIVQT